MTPLPAEWPPLGSDSGRSANPVSPPAGRVAVVPGRMRQEPGVRSRLAWDGARARIRPGRPGPWRLAVAATVRAAVPWQGLRGRSGGPLRILPGDLRVRVARRPERTLAALVVDGSASMASRPLRLGKGALGPVLDELYRRRAHVALIACQGSAARLVAAPGPGVERVRAALAGLGAGGGTPIASGLALALDLVRQARRRGIGRTEVLVVTDGQANLPASPPPPGAEPAPWLERELVALGAALRELGSAITVLDPRPPHRAGGASRRLAGLLGAAWGGLAARASATTPEGRGSTGS